MIDLENIRPAWLEINLDNLKANFEELKKILNPNSKIAAVVKANAYGHGSVEISKALLRYGVDRLAVSTVDEGVELRKSGIDAPILLLNGWDKFEMNTILEYNLTPTIYELSTAYELNNKAKIRDCKINAHVRVAINDGNMGVMQKSFKNFILEISKLENIKVEGIYTHLYAAYGTNCELTKGQINDFNSLINEVKNFNINALIIHAASTPAIMYFPESHYDMVRAGNILYGIEPEIDYGLNIEEYKIAIEKYDNRSIHNNLKPVVQLKARIIDIKEISDEYWIDYGKEFPIEKGRVIATIAMGYADAFPLVYSEQTKVIIHGKKVPVFGKASMDYFIIDVTGIENVKKGDIVVILGEQDGSTITAEEIALRTRMEKSFDGKEILLNKRISRAQVCMFSPRLPRIYVEDGVVIKRNYLSNGCSESRSEVNYNE